MSRDYGLIDECAIACIHDQEFYSKVCNANHITVAWMESRVGSLIYRLHKDLYRKMTPPVRKDVAYYILDHYNEAHKDVYSDGVIHALSVGRAAEVFEPPEKSYDVLHEEINEHVKKAESYIKKVTDELDRIGVPWQQHNPLNGDYTCSPPDKETYEEYEMSTTNFTTKHFINKEDITGMSDATLVQHIKNLEADIVGLKKVKTKTKGTKRMIKEAKKNIASIVEQFDKRG